MRDHSKTPRGHGSLGSHDRSERWPLAIGLVLSACIHVLVLGVWPHATGTGPMPRTERASARAPSVSPAMHVIAITSVAMERPPTPEPVQPPRLPRRPVPAVETPDDAVDTEPGAVTPAERLAPRLGDPRIWAWPATDLTADGSAARAHTAESIQTIADSARRAEDAIRRFRDWTFTDGAGRRWGISPAGQLYLGGLFGHRHPTLELVGASRVAARFRDWGAFRNQAAQFQVDTTLEQRIRAIRARKDAERKHPQASAPPPRGR